MKHVNRAGLTLAVVSLMAAGGCSQGMEMGNMTMDRDAMVAGWSQASQEAVQFMTDKYGAPVEMTATMAVWNQTGPWKRTIVYSEAIQHDFPMPHPDVMEQFVDYRMPVQMFDEIAAYDGSVIVERTKGEMSARCDKEPANFLALNLANEIAMGRLSVDDARRMYGEQIMMAKAGRMTEYTSGLMFTPPASGNDPGRSILEP